MGRRRPTHRLGRLVGVGATAILATVCVLVILIAALSTLASGINLTSASGSDAIGGTFPGSATPGGPTIPPTMLVLYRQAASTCRGLPWAVLAGIGTVESSNGTSNLPGVHGGTNPAGAEGPMQFEPATFARYDLPVPPGGANPPNPYNPTDAVFAAAHMLCADGAGSPATLPSAVFDYNHSDVYVDQVLSLATEIEAAYATSGTTADIAESSAVWTPRPPTPLCLPSTDHDGEPRSPGRSIGSNTLSTMATMADRGICGPSSRYRWRSRAGPVSTHSATSASGRTSPRTTPAW